MGDKIHEEDGEGKKKTLAKRENIRRIRTRMPTLIAAYKYAKFRAMRSFDPLKRAMASVPIKTDILRYETHAIIFHKKKAPKINSRSGQWKGNRTYCVHSQTTLYPRPSRASESS